MDGWRRQQHREHLRLRERQPNTGDGQTIPTNNYAQFECLAPSAAGTFTVPPAILLALPGVTGASSNGGLFVYLQANPRQVVIPGADYSFAAWNTATVGANATYQ
ncbi:MAG TPA: hypothetical protein VIL63_12855 [Terriglobales bacterium]